MEAILQFNQYELPKYRGNLLGLIKEIEEKGRKITQITGELNTTPKCVITDGSGRACLTFWAMGGTITFWDYRTKAGLMSLSDVPSQIEMGTIICFVENGNKWCGECKNWFPKDTSMRRVGFVGLVCPTCFNPKKHHTFSTVGD